MQPKVLFLVFADHETRQIGQERHRLVRRVVTYAMGGCFLADLDTGTCFFPSRWSAARVVRHGVDQGVVPSGELQRAKREVKARLAECQERRWQQRYSQEIEGWVNILLQGLDLEFTDNVRVACVRDRRALRAYRRQGALGCCGFYDETHTGPDGRKYLIGCNYGH